LPLPQITHARLTDQQVRRLRPGARPIDLRDGQSRGLILSVFPSGRKVFSVRYVFGGKHRRVVLGEYPHQSLAAARDAAGAMRQRILRGEDPAAERKAAKAERVDTVAVLAADYLAKYAAGKRSVAEDQRILNRDVLPTWADRSVRELTRRDVRELVDRVTDRGSPVMANRVLACVRTLLNYAVDQDWIDANPAARIKKPGAEGSRDRVLTDEEIRRVWRVLSHVPSTSERPAPGRPRARGATNDPLCPLSPWLAATLKVRLLTAQRGGEVVRMRWADLDLDRGWWTIPAAFTKNKRLHRVPLTKAVMTLIRAQEPKAGARGAFVFTGPVGGTAADRAKKASALVARALGIDFKGHDLRRTASTKMTEAGVPAAHVAKVLNHVENEPRSTRVYDRHTYDAEKRIALETWARTLRAIIKNTRGTVVPFARAAGGR